MTGEDSYNKCVEHFQRMAPERRESVKKNYAQIIEAAEMGRENSCPWMVPHWQRGLEILNEVIKNSSQ